MDVITAVTGLRAAADTVRSIANLTDTTAIKGKVIELQQSILTAQSEALEGQHQRAILLQKISELEADLQKAKGWQDVANSYELVRLEGGVFAYSLKANATGEPHHLICSNCFQAARKSILQSLGTAHGVQTLKCPACETSIHTGTFRSPLKPVRSVPSRWMAV